MLNLQCYNCKGFGKIRSTFDQEMICNVCNGWKYLPIPTLNTENIAPNKEPSYGIQSLPDIFKPISHLEKYWGSITSICANDNFTLKKIVMKPHTQSSMEYHVHKHEYYYILSGTLKVGLRIGRAQNKSIILNQNDWLEIKPGLMHMRINESNKDVVIIEWSNKDDDSDSHLVEDGKKYIHVDEE